MLMDGPMMDIEIYSDKYRPRYIFQGLNNGVKVKTINKDGTIVDRLISDQEFGEMFSRLYADGYIIKIR